MLAILIQRHTGGAKNMTSDFLLLLLFFFGGGGGGGATLFSVYEH